MSIQQGSVKPALTLIWHRWNGLKHIWEPGTNWPFSEAPSLNDELVLSGGKVIVLQRRNLLRRYVSNVICRRLDFWVGTRQEFLSRVAKMPMQELNPSRVRRELQLQQEAVERRIDLLQKHCVEFRHLFYEDFYSTNAGLPQKFELLNQIFTFLGFRNVSKELFEFECAQYFREDSFRWASADVYRLIPGISRVEREVGSEQTGWLFKD